MTREEALDVLIIKANKGDFVKDIINQIFDEHEMELKTKDERIKELETPKSCETCKHYLHQLNICLKKIEAPRNQYKTFCCNRWVCQSIASSK